MNAEQAEPEFADERALFHHVIFRAPQHNKKGITATRNRTLARQVAWLTFYATNGLMERTCKSTGTWRSTVWRWRNSDEVFRSAFRLAEFAACSRFEDAAVRRCIYGTPKYVFRNGRPCVDPSTGRIYIEQTYSDLLVIFMLKHLAPEHYGDNVDCASQSCEFLVRFEDGYSGTPEFQANALASA